MTFLSDTILLAFATAWLVLIFIPILLSPDYFVGIWYENNPIILCVEIIVCVFAVVWAAMRIVSNIKKERDHYDKA